MGHIFYNLFMACCMFILAMSGFVLALSMWRRCSNKQTCNKCNKELNK